MRTLAAAAITSLFAWAAISHRGDPSTLGRHLFYILGIGFIIAILIIISALTSDTISREKREGTLGLLFLTPLSPREIVVGKCLLQLFRGIPVILAIAPVVALPFLLGGISTFELLALAVTSFQAVLIAIAAGIVASIHNTAWIRSIVMAEMLGFTQAIGIIMVNLFVYGLTRQSSLSLSISTAWALFIFFGAIFLAGNRIKHSWQADSVSDREPFWIRLFSSSDFWSAAFHWNTAKARDKNPIAWLQEYNWTSRLTKWGWAILLFAAQVRMLFHIRRYVDYQLQLYVLVAFGIAFSAAASFRAERQTGALELLLVTPISAAKLIWGRLQGIWFHFLPPIAILATVWIMGPQWISLPHRYLFYLAGAYFCIPLIGFYVSLLTANVLVAWLITLFFSMLLPYAITNAFNLSRYEIPIVFSSVQAFLALGAFYLLHEHLANRRFALSA